MNRRSEKMSRVSYCQFLLSSQINYTQTHYAEHVASLSHDMVNRYMRESKLTPSLVWEHVQGDVIQSQSGYIALDDTVLDKSHSRKIETARFQYSGNAHDVIRGIGMINVVYINPELKKFWIIDFRIYSPDCDGKAKTQHVQDMLLNVIHHKKLSFKTVLMDSWYASSNMMLFISDLDKIFYCPVKSNRLARPADNQKQLYQSISSLPLTDDELARGKAVRLKNMPRDFPMRLFRVPVTSRRTEHVVTNDPAQYCQTDTQKVCAIRWYVEQFHREIKQLTGVENCECRKGRAQRNHILCAVLVWIKLKRLAYQTTQTVYEIKHNLLREYLMQELRQPRIAMT